ncbi:MAG: hypoxanthine phosphoribosyltransferase [Clostridiales bacterium]|jgi:hypoxanthine phosphoribosyltransferase|nr:hypoxanthine phosphoribosyltransferase [Clostridiales bacterium]
MAENKRKNYKSLTDDLTEILLTEQQIDERIGEMAEEISEYYEDKQPILVSILKGSFVFMADLVRKLNIDCTLDFMIVSSYGTKSKSTGAVKIIKDLDIDIENKHILLVEDILDSGLTLSYIKRILETKKPASLRICTLLDKPDRRTANITAEYVGFTIPDKFIVGYGLDYAERYRNLPMIGILNPEIYADE